jgi:formylglycine-generating enzyme required for sulfatase activity
MSDIFISYKREEQAVARELANALEKQGWTVWWDPKLRAGERFDDVIEVALKNSKCVIVMWSRRSVQSEYVKDEALYALRRKKLVPVAIEDVELPFRFEGLHTPQLTGWGGNETVAEFCRLVEDISAIIGSPAEKTGKKTPSHKPAEVQKTESQPPEKTLEPGTVFCDTLQDGSKGPEMVVIPPGQFKMGDLWGDGRESEKPVHTVHIPRPFALGHYPVTFDEYDRFASATGRELPDDQEWGRGRHPVIHVSGEDAVAYAIWLSEQTGKRYRLPSEAEWEYAARSGGKEEKWAGTSADGELGDYVWYDGNSGGKTHPVGEKKPNGLGLCDMSGNVWEWVADWWNDSYAGAPDSGLVWESGDSELLVTRGGSWRDEPWFVRSAVRIRDLRDGRCGGNGFRLAQDL